MVEECDGMSIIFQNLKERTRPEIKKHHRKTFNVNIANPEIGMLGFHKIEQISASRLFRWCDPLCSLFLVNSKPTGCEIEGFHNGHQFDCSVYVEDIFVARIQKPQNLSKFSFKIPDLDRSFLTIMFDFSNMKETPSESDRQLGYAFERIKFTYGEGK